MTAKFNSNTAYTFKARGDKPHPLPQSQNLKNQIWV